eukprot:tig00021428_g21151.t1
MIIGARVIVVGKTYGPLSSGESQAEAWSESPGLERRAGVQLESPSCQCCLLTLLNRQDVPERIITLLLTFARWTGLGRTTLRRRSQGKVLASCLPSRAERDAEPHVLWMQGGVKWSATAAVVDTLATIERHSRLGATDIWLDELDVPEKGSYVVGARARSWHLVCLLEPRETRSRTSSGCRVESSGAAAERASGAVVERKD